MMTPNNSSFKNIIFIAGSGRNVGKSFLGEYLLGQISALYPVNSLKITSHFYEPTSGLVLLKKGTNWRLFEETRANDGKDSERYLMAGAEHSYYAEVEQNSLQLFVNELHAFIDINKILLVESAVLGNFITPNFAFFIQGEGEKVCTWNFPYVELQSIDSKIVSMPKSLIFKDEKWQIEW